MIFASPQKPKALFKILLELKFKAVKNKYLSKLNKLEYALTAQAVKETFVISPSSHHTSLHEINNYSRLSALQHEVLFYLKQQIQTNYQTWYKTQRQQLNNETWWNELKIKNDVIEKIHQAWKAQYRYKYYRSESLVFIYQQVIPAYANWIEFAKTELNLKRHKLSQAQLTQYAAYLNSLITFLEQHKNAIRISMLARLRAANKEQDIRFDDLTVATIKNLQHLQAIPEQEITHLPQRGITPKVFYSFLYILQKEATEDQTKELLSLPYFNLKTNVALESHRLQIRKNQEGVGYFIPITCAALIPTKLPFYLKLPEFLHGFFTGRKIRHEFFQNAEAQYLLLANSTIDNLKVTETITLTTLHHLPFLHTIHNFEILLLAEQRRKDTLTKKTSNIFHKKARQVLINYGQRLQHIGITLTNKKVELLQKIIVQYETRDTNLNVQEKLSLRALLTEIQEDKNKWGADFNFMHLEAQCYMKLLIDKRIPVPNANITNAAQTLPHLDTTDKEKLLQRFDIAINKQPLLLEQIDLAAHLKEVKLCFTLITDANKLKFSAKKLRIQLHQYTLKFIESICALDSKEAFTTSMERIKLIIDLLKTLNQDNQIFQNEIIKDLDSSINESNHLSWKELVEQRFNYLKLPLSDFLKHYSSTSIPQDAWDVAKTEQATDLFTEGNNYFAN